MVYHQKWQRHHHHYAQFEYRGTGKSTIETWCTYKQMCDKLSATSLVYQMIQVEPAFLGSLGHTFEHRRHGREAGASSTETSCSNQPLQAYTDLVGLAIQAPEY